MCEKIKQCLAARDYSISITYFIISHFLILYAKMKITLQAGLCYKNKPYIYFFLKFCFL